MFHFFVRTILVSFSTILGALFFVLGLVLGSFGNVLVHRLPRGERITGRSKCPGCQATLRARDLIPVISYLLLCGRCRSCKSAISLRYPIVEVLSGLLFLAAFLQSIDLRMATLLGVSLWLLFLMAIVDAGTQGIPDVLNIPFIVLSILYGVLAGHLSVLGFIIGVGFFGLQWLLSRGRWIGSGDILLAVGLTALLGRWELVTAMLCMSYIIGAVAAAYLLLRKKKHGKETLAFAPFLALGTIITLFAGDRILAALFLL